MKAISAALQAHLSQTVTTLATCWQIIRTDGTVYALTSHDVDLTIAGVTYYAAVGLTSTAISTGSQGAVDNLDVTGFTAGAGISLDDLKAGLFDYAQVNVFLVNWANLGMGILKLRTGWLGEVTVRPNGTFQAEVRGLTQALVQEYGTVYQPICRADLGDSKCQVPIKPAPWVPGSYAAGAYVQAATQPDDAHKVAIFQAQNAGATGATEPVWNTPIGETTTDGGITWLSQPYYRSIAAVTATIDQHNFVATALNLPAVTVQGSNTNTAIITLRANLSAGTILEVSDGINTATVDWTGAQAMKDALPVILQALDGRFGTQFTVRQQGYIIYLTNNSGKQGNITKVGDQLGGLVFQNFAAPLFDGCLVTWISGENTGTSVEIKTYDQASGLVQLWLAAPYPVQAGDRFFFYPACDKRRDTCYNRFNNILNFRGEPDMPGMDSVLSYPQS